MPHPLYRSLRPNSLPALKKVRILFRMIAHQTNGLPFLPGFLPGGLLLRRGR